MGHKFTAKDIAVIIDACSRSNVTEFTLGELKIVFRGLSGNLDLQKTYPDQWSAPVVTSAVSAEEIALPKVELSEVDKEMLKEAAVSQLMLDDPLAYEQYIIDEQTARDGFLSERHSRTQQGVQ